MLASRKQKTFKK